MFVVKYRLFHEGVSVLSHSHKNLESVWCSHLLCDLSITKASYQADSSMSFCYIDTIAIHIGENIKRNIHIIGFYLIHDYFMIYQSKVRCVLYMNITTLQYDFLITIVI